MKTFYLDRAIKARNGKIHHRGSTIQTDDPAEIKFIEDQLNSPLKKIPITPVPGGAVTQDNAPDQPKD